MPTHLQIESGSVCIDEHGVHIAIHAVPPDAYEKLTGGEELICEPTEEDPSLLRVRCYRGPVNVTFYCRENRDVQLPLPVVSDL